MQNLKIPVILLLLGSLPCAMAQETEKNQDPEKEKKTSVSFSYAYKTDPSSKKDGEAVKTQVFVTSDGAPHPIPNKGKSQLWVTSSNGHPLSSSQALTVLGSSDHDHSEQPFVLHFSPNHGFLGIESVELTEELRLHFGAPKDTGIMIGRVTEDGAAAQAGLQVGDILTHLNEQPIGDSIQLLKILIETKPGDPMNARVWRDGEIYEAPVVLSELDSEEHTFSNPDGKVEIILNSRSQSNFNLSTWHSDDKPKVEWIEVDQSHLKMQLDALQAKINELEKKILKQKQQDH